VAVEILKAATDPNARQAMAIVIYGQVLKTYSGLRLNGASAKQTKMTYRDEIRAYLETAIGYHLTADSPRAPQPTTVTVPLRPHQLSLLAAARALEAKATLGPLTEPQLMTHYGVIADRVGAGKSLVALSLVSEPAVNPSSMTITDGGRMQYTRIVEIQAMPPVQELPDPDTDYKALLTTGPFYTRAALLITPHNIVQQWEAYIKEQTTLRPYIVKRTKDCDYDRAGFYHDVFSADIVVVSCTMLKKFMGALQYHGNNFDRIVWSRLFIDEADSITMTLRPYEVASRFIWFITGSWVNMLFPYGIYSFTIQDLPDGLRKIVGDGGIPGILSRTNVVSQAMAYQTREPRFTALVLRNTDAWIDTSLTMPTIRHSSVICKAPANLGVLRDFIPAAAMEALHAGDTAGALEALGLKAASKETLAERVTASLRTELNQAEKLLVFKRDMEYSSPAAKATAIEKAEAKVTRLQEQLASLTTRIAEAEGQRCPICFESPRTATLTPCCRHSFCLACLCECISAKPACPLCRVAIRSPKELLVIGEGVAPTEVDTLPMKGAALLKLLAESTENQRFLVFSAHEASFRGLREVLASRGIRCEMLQGSGARVEVLRKQFQAGTVRVLCMNARHVGAGINLEAATHVVLYHRMNMELERQVIGRAVRFERAAALEVVHLVHEEETGYNGSSSSEVIVHV